MFCVLFCSVATALFLSGFFFSFSLVPFRLFCSPFPSPFFSGGKGVQDAVLRLSPRAVTCGSGRARRRGGGDSALSQGTPGAASPALPSGAISCADSALKRLSARVICRGKGQATSAGSCTTAKMYIYVHTSYIFLSRRLVTLAAPRAPES